MDEGEAQDVERPRTRADCAHGLRPCPWIGCKFHLADPKESTRGVLHALGASLSRESDPAEVDRVTDAMAESVVSMRESCALDVVDREADGATLESTGQAYGISRERVRQIESRTLRTLRPRSQRIR